jgi:alkylated DNA repair dioxygenase AlkB
MSYKGNRVGTKFLDSNLKAVNVVYNPSSMGWHADGKPSEVDLTLSFGEPRTLDAQDIRDGF